MLSFLQGGTELLFLACGWELLPALGAGAACRKVCGVLSPAAVVWTVARAGQGRKLLLELLHCCGLALHGWCAVCWSP